MIKILPFGALISLLFLLAAKGAVAEEKPLPKRLLQNINANWQYLEKNVSDVHDLAQQTGWTTIDLPHTWNQWDVMDMNPGYRRDASWYQKEMFIDNFEAAHYLLYFEGANISSEIYINGQLAGTHVGGYVGFEIDISQWVKKGEKNLLSVRVDNGYNPDIIPSQKSDFFIYGGITRDVWLKIVPKTYLQNIAVSTPTVSAAMAETSVKIQLNDQEEMDGNYVATIKIIDRETGKAIIEKTLKAQELITEKTIDLPAIKQPKLWSPENPQLYTLQVQLLRKGQVVDEKTETIGYRWYSFENHGPFFLNGKRLLLRGTHRHEEHAGYGAAMPNHLHREDIAMIKEMGANFIRLGHYPQDPEIYKACDELGLIVWDELPWCRGGIGGEEWKKNSRRLLKEQIAQNFNHPSIFFWSLGNEIYWLPDFEGGDEEAKMNAFVTELNDIAHDLDPDRLTAIRKYYAGADLVDVFSPSIWSGWYAGVYTNYEKTLKKNQELYPRFLHMEYGGSSHVGRHTENPITGNGVVNEDDWAEVANQVNIENIAKGGDWTENYIVDLFDWYLGVTEQQDQFAGNAQWAFKDFGTPLRPENAIPYMNLKGLVDRSGKPKDAYYVYKSYWAKKPFTYIESHSWTERMGPENKTRNVSVFSNCEEVELWQEGQSLKIKKRVVGEFPACGLNWDVEFKEGKNQLIAKGFKTGKLIAADTLTVDYTYQKADKADHIQLDSRPLANGHLLIEAKMLDKNGQRVLDYEKAIYFAQDGAGELLKNYGTPTRSQVIQMANGRAAIEFIPGKGKTVIEVRNQDFKGSYLVIDSSQKTAKGSIKKTQALLLTQPFDFDAADKDKVKGDYMAQTKITIPNNLATQSKWMMFEGPVLENDWVAYRYYADSRHRFDIYGKSVSNLVLDTVSWNYHDIMNWGSDILKVGNSLGIGSPAIWYKDSLYTLSECDKKTIEIIENGDLSSAIRTTFWGLNIEGNKIDLIQDWTLSAGHPWSEIRLEVLNGTLPSGMFFATGIVKHLSQITTGEAYDNFYAFTWGEQSFHHQNLGMAILAAKQYQPEAIADEWSHAYVFKNASKEINYSFMAAWEAGIGQVKTRNEFKTLVEKACQNQQQ